MSTSRLVYFGIRLNKRCKDRFMGLCKASGRDAGIVLEQLMARWSEQARKELGRD